MASRLVPLLIAALAAAAIGCGGGKSLTGAGPGAATSGSTATGARSGAAAENSQSFANAGPKKRARIWAVGDSAGGAHASAVATLIHRERPDKVLYLGDIYNGDAGFAAYKRLYAGLPVARTPGNHDWPRYWPKGKPEWYSFTAGGWRVIELNSETARGTAQLGYLQTLLRARGTCRLAFWHRPRFSAGPHGDNADMDPYWRALQGHATIVLSGHDHDMQRFRAHGGLIQLVAGAGGYTHYPVNRAKAGLAFADAVHWGALRIELSRGRAKLAFVSTAGHVLDSAQVACRP